MTTVSSTDTASTTAPARFDIYGQSHKALRACMCETLTMIGRFDCDDAQSSKQALDELDALLDHCEAHLANEERFVHPLLDAIASGASRRIAGEHDEHRSAIAALRRDIEGLAQAEDTASRAAIARTIYRRLAAFVADNLLHMETEESANNAMLWAAYADAELVEVHADIVAATPPDDLPWHARWLAVGLRPCELAELFAGLRASMPAAVFADVAGLLRPHLETARWQQLAVSFGLAGALGDESTGTTSCRAGSCNSAAQH